MHNSLVHFLSSLVFIVLQVVPPNGCTNSGIQGTISCFVCSSRNGSDSECEDPFNASESYTKNCMVPRRGHTGLFPAHFCIKIFGTSYTTGEKIVIRRCTTETMDTQCGKFKFEHDLLKGCILTCDLDGCNSSNFLQNSKPLLVITAFASLAVFFCCLNLDLNIPNFSQCPNPKSSELSSFSLLTLCKQSMETRNKLHKNNINSEQTKILKLDTCTENCLPMDSCVH